MKKKIPSRGVWTFGRGWQRIKAAGKTIYKHNGKFTTKKKFADAFRRKVDSKPKWRKIVGKETSVEKNYKAPKRTQKFTEEFCRLKTREKFYETVLKDRADFRKKLGEEESSAFQLWFQIGDGEKRKKRSDKRLQYTHGLRKFTNLKKARLFLGIDGVLTSGDKPLPKWRKSGKESVCNFEKKAWLVMSRTVGGRARKPKILKKYIIQE